MPSATPPPSLSVVVPVYNSAPSLPVLVERLQPVLAAQTEDYELILVNDGSTDGSWKAAESLALEHGWIRSLDLMRNYGQHNALLCGIREASNDVIVTMDDDLQHPPEEIPKLLAHLAEGHEVVYGTPEKKPHGVWRNVASTVTKFTLQRSMRVGTAQRVSAFRAFRTQLRDAFSGYKSQYVSIDVLLTWGTTSFSSVEVRHDPRLAGVSNYTFWKLLTHTLNMVTGFSTLPLQLATVLGFALTMFGVVVLGWVLGNYLLSDNPLPGFTFLASTIAIFSGAQLFALGIMGEYLARMHGRLMERPAYAVRDEVSRDS